MLKRLPISLKIDDDDSDFYYGLIEEKRKNRELTTLILNLLKLYHTDSEVRKAADDFMVSQNPYLKIHEELQRIALEHRKQTTATGMLGDFTRNERKKVDIPDYEEEPVSEKEKQKETTLLMQEEINQLKKMVQNQVVSTPVNTEVNNVAPYISTINNVSPVVSVAPSVEPVLNYNENITDKVIPNEHITDKVIPNEQGVEQKKTVPKSFKKMMSSVQ